MTSFEFPPPPPTPPPAQPNVNPIEAQNVCSLCDANLDMSQRRCSSCGLYQELGQDRPNPFRDKTLVLVAGVLIGVYFVVLAIVAVLPAASK